MAQVGEHAEAVHLADHVLAERRQAAVLGRVRGRVGPRGVLRVRQRHVARAEPREHPQRAERGIDGVAALHADERRDLPRREDPLHVVRSQREFEILGVTRHHAVDDVDLFERGGHRLLARQRRRHVHRPELRADAAPAHPGNVGHRVGAGAPDVERGGVLSRPLPDLPRIVVVAVEHRDREVKRPGTGEERVISLSGRQGTNPCHGRARRKTRRRREQSPHRHATSFPDTVAPPAHDSLPRPRVGVTTPVVRRPTAV